MHRFIFVRIKEELCPFANISALLAKSADTQAAANALGKFPKTSAPTLAQPRYEPIGVKRRNVRLAAGGKDYGC